MTLSAIQRFNDRVVNDDALQAKIDAARTGTEIIAIAADAGFEVTASDLKDFADQVAFNQLSIDQLEHVSGGLSGTDLGSGRVIDRRPLRGLARRLLDTRPDNTLILND